MILVCRHAEAGNVGVGIYVQNAAQIDVSNGRWLGGTFIRLYSLLGSLIYTLRMRLKVLLQFKAVKINFSNLLVFFHSDPVIVLVPQRL